MGRGAKKDKRLAFKIKRGNVPKRVREFCHARRGRKPGSQIETLIKQDMTEFKNKFLKRSHQLTIKVSPEIIKELESEAEREDVAVNTVVNRVLETHYFGKTIDEIINEVMVKRK